MNYRLQQVTRARNLETRYEGINVRHDHLRLSTAFAARLRGVERVRLACDTRAKVIAITPHHSTKGPLTANVFTIARSKSSKAAIYCRALTSIMPKGRYRFLRKTRDGYICKYDLSKS